MGAMQLSVTPDQRNLDLHCMSILVELELSRHALLTRPHNTRTGKRITTIT